jgi:hypothetical protein
MFCRICYRIRRTQRSSRVSSPNVHGQCACLLRYEYGPAGRRNPDETDVLHANTEVYFDEPRKARLTNGIDKNLRQRLLKSVAIFLDFCSA